VVFQLVFSAVGSIGECFRAEQASEWAPGRNLVRWLKWRVKSNSLFGVDVDVVIEIFLSLEGGFTVRT
jgi:hypothetical protein